ncbi:MAG: hypothetical protein H6876_02860 [Hyphomicrobiaceae bacterium]|nr:hypothetical protein [Hyphomicrobiaceae bacterium]
MPNAEPSAAGRAWPLHAGTSCQDTRLARMHSAADAVLRLLFTVTHVGTPVIIAGSHSEPREVVHPGLVLADYAEHEFESVVQSR